MAAGNPGNIWTSLTLSHLDEQQTMLRLLSGICGVIVRWHAHLVAVDFENGDGGKIGLQPTPASPGRRGRLPSVNQLAFGGVIV